MEYTVGQKLWFVPSHNERWSSQKEVTVRKVGRKWVELDTGQRIEKGKRIIDGGDYSSPGSVYSSKQEYDNYVSLNNAWDDLRRTIDKRYSPPDGMTIEKIEQAKAILFNRESE